MENLDEDGFYARLDEILGGLTRDTPTHDEFSDTPYHHMQHPQEDEEEEEGEEEEVLLQSRYEEPQQEYHYERQHHQNPEEELEHLMLVMESKIMRRFNDLETKLNSFSFKQMKRKRTGNNRCKSLNRKGQLCNGYVCKNKSKHLCYAHYVLIDKQKEKANYLYSKKK